GASLDPAGVSACARFTVTGLLAADPQRPANQAVLQTGGVTVVVADRRRPYHDIADFSALGLDPRQVKILVVKSGYLSPELAPLANPNLMALSEGVVDQDIERVARLRMLTPTWPFKRDLEFTPLVRVSARSPFAREC
ncbi:TPA: MlrC C-terminal domain-containing protein, partial [Klebsiella aerogenes]